MILTSRASVGLCDCRFQQTRFVFNDNEIWVALLCFQYATRRNGWIADIMNVSHTKWILEPICIRNRLNCVVAEKRNVDTVLLFC